VALHRFWHFPRTLDLSLDFRGPIQDGEQSTSFFASGVGHLLDSLTPPAFPTSTMRATEASEWQTAFRQRVALWVAVLQA
jgi:hypothetical protein